MTDNESLWEEGRRRREMSRKEVWKGEQKVECKECEWKVEHGGSDGWVVDFTGTVVDDGVRCASE